MPIIPITVSGQLDVSGQINISGKVNVSGVLNVLMGDNPSAGGWTPASLGAPLIGWYKADAGVYVDAGSTLATNGQSVQQWNDQSGTGNHLTQATSGNRPVYTTSLLNSLPGVVFTSASTQWIANQAIALGGTTASVFIVGKVSATPSSNGRLVSFTATAAAHDFDNTPSAAFIYNFAVDGLRAYRNGALSDRALTDNTFGQIGSVFDSVDNIFYVNGVAGTPTSSTATFAATGALAVGAFVDTPPASTTGASPLDGTICEVIFTNSALDVTDRGLLATYLTAKWGV